MDQDCLQELQGALEIRNSKQAILQKQVGRAFGMQIEQDTDQVVVAYHLRPQEADLEIAHLNAKEVVVVHKQGIWKTAKLVGRCKEGQHEGKLEYVGMNREGKAMEKAVT